MPNGFELQAIDLEVKAGEVVALVGPSGAGKTTLAKLVPRFHDVKNGALLVDGRDIRELSLGSLRAQIGLVAQETFLFNDTVASNIAYGRPDVGMAEIRRAAETALAHEFIERLPEGYNTVIGDRGTKLSGGQRQRLAIARALLKNAPILILDEATSHLDTESEMLVQRALANLMEYRTVIVIAHRLSTIRRADKIVVHGTGPHSRSGNACRAGAPGRHLPAAARAAVRAGGDRSGTVSVRSMTGFARVRRVAEQGEIVVSLKSVNHRGLDMHFHMPPEFDAIEHEVRGVVKGAVARGHVQVHLSFTPAGTTGAALNRELFTSYLQAFREAAAQFEIAGQPDLNAALRIPGMFAAGGGEEAGRSRVPGGARNGTGSGGGAECLPRARRRGHGRRDARAVPRSVRAGDAHGGDSRGRRAGLSEAPAGAPGANCCAARVDPQRLAQEAAMLADRSDIAEELVRLRTHAAQLEKLLERAGEVGKRLDFLLQEMNREANTILSKTGGLGDLGLTITDLALAAKSEIDKIREQSLNLE